MNNARFGELQTRGGEAEETFSAIAGAVDRASEIVNRLLTFARSDPQTRVEIDLPALLEEVCALLRPGLPSAIELVCEADDDLGTVVGDPSSIHQVVVNLITNAAQALGTDEAGCITVTADTIELTGDESDAGGVSAGRYARIRVHDTGPGIPESVASRVFDPFFTTKPKGEGTGLGLAAALTIAQDHRGTLDLRSAPGGGTTATLCLPESAKHGRRTER